MIHTKEESTTYRRLKDDQELVASEAEHYLMFSGMCRVLRHEATVKVRYLIELHNGERRWVDADEDC
jgi:hypothetical protein